MGCGVHGGDLAWVDGGKGLSGLQDWAFGDWTLGCSLDGHGELVWRGLEWDANGGAMECCGSRAEGLVAWLGVEAGGETSGA